MLKDLMIWFCGGIGRFRNAVHPGIPGCKFHNPTIPQFHNSKGPRHEARGTKKGSVMMEFIIVFPIYLVLFGGLMAIGDMVFHSIRLPSAERTRAFDLGGVLANGWQRVLDTMYHPGMEIADDEGHSNQDALSTDDSVYYVSSIENPWTVRTATIATDAYRLPAGGTAAQLLFADWFFNDTLGDNSPRATGDFASLLKSESVPMQSKRVRISSADFPKYNYYTLRRARYSQDPENDGSDVGWRDNRRPSSQLLCDFGNGSQAWDFKVYDEKYHDEINDSANSPSGPPEIDLDKKAEYVRYSGFTSWDWARK